MMLVRLFSSIKTTPFHRIIITAASHDSSGPHLFLFKNIPRRYCSSKEENNLLAPFFHQAEKYDNKVAIIDQHGSFTYNHLLHHSKQLSARMVETLKNGNYTDWSRIAFLCENDVSYVVAQWAIWMIRGVAVPLCKIHPEKELQYVVENSQCSMIISTEEYLPKVDPIAKKMDIPVISLLKDNYVNSFNTKENAWYLSHKKSNWSDQYYDLMNKDFYTDKPCLIIYTSGTTGKPKGVVLTYGNVLCNILGMIERWEWTLYDTILNVLPLHHVHGVVNALMVPLYCGATVIMLPKFNAHQVWELLVGSGLSPVTVFMAVPTIYSKLIEYHESNRIPFGISAEFIKMSCLSKIRLMVSGSAALQTTVMAKWKDITGHDLLERYGMTELGMVLTNPLHGPRIPGVVGMPFPNVQVAIGKPNFQKRNTYEIIASGNELKISFTPGAKEEQGELLVKGPNVFKEYWNNPKATTEAFTSDGWFKTGDTVVYSKGTFRILGRTSVDIIKSGGYKISALDVERHLLEHNDIQECAVVGLPDITWGQKVGALVVTKSNTQLNLQELKKWCSDKIPSYQTPTVLKTVEEIPRNAMGKINKKDIVQNFFKEYTYV